MQPRNFQRKILCSLSTKDFRDSGIKNSKTVEITTHSCVYKGLFPLRKFSSSNVKIPFVLSLSISCEWEPTGLRKIVRPRKISLIFPQN